MTVNAEFRKLYTQLNVDFYMKCIPQDANIYDIIKSQEQIDQEKIEAEIQA